MTLTRRTSPKRTRKKRSPEGPLSPEEWRYRVRVLTAREWGGWALCDDCWAASAMTWPEPHIHHVVSKQALRRRRLYDRVWDERNGLVLCPHVHMDHEVGAKRIPRSALPQSVWEFAQEIDEAGPERWAVAYLERTYPEHYEGSVVA